MSSRLDRTPVRVKDAIARIPVEAAAVARLKPLAKVHKDVGVLEGHSGREPSLVRDANELGLKAGTAANKLDKGFFIEVDVSVGKKQLLTLEVELLAGSRVHRGRERW